LSRASDHALPGSGPQTLKEELWTPRDTAWRYPFIHAARHDQDERPHACNDGWVTIGQLVIDPETGEETEEYALYLCRNIERMEWQS
jgi:hypothetical protein